MFLRSSWNVSQVFEDMISRIGVMHSYDGGDTGFLNSYFHDWSESCPQDDVECSHQVYHGRGKSPSIQIQRSPHHVLADAEETRAASGILLRGHVLKIPGRYWNAVGAVRCLHFCSFPKPWDQVGE